ncbi:Pycsar system effector family protein [Streptomyces sindenensis]|uniref:Pycsar system effector family protein n=1 Tax=Streptomyces sindenensis TaxID=67363 RepID=A0ABW6EQL5_9ACTN
MTEYAPVDVTPPELRPSALALHVPEWAEAAATPADVTDWAARQARALIPFQVDENGWPMHPQGRTGRIGRNLGLWGENQAADPIVVAGYGQERRVLLITRSDIEQEAIPGGMVDAHLGETAPAALVRELREETGVDLRDHTPVILGRDVVADWRASDHAWVSSTSALYQLPATVTAVGADDALDANWYPFGDLAQLETAITAAGRTLYAAHRPLLQRALDHLATPVSDERMSQARGDVMTEIVRTDAKAASLLTASSLPLAVLVAVVPGRDIGPAAAVLVGIGAIGLVAALITVLLTIRPRLSGDPNGSYLRWANCTPEELAEDLTTDRRLERLATLSQIAEQKYRALRLAIDVTSGALIVLVLALLLVLVLALLGISA